MTNPRQHIALLVPFVIVEVECNRDLGTTDDALCGMNEEPHCTTVQHMSNLPTWTTGELTYTVLEGT